ncbi:MAG: archease [Pseudomonadota bacterium]|nr:archease [Pseudomonadota bacterium]
MSFRIIDHTADMGVEARGATLADLFRQGAAALLSLCVESAAVTPAGERAIRVEGADPTDLWINYLRDILYLLNGEGFIVREVRDIAFSRTAAGAGPDGEAGGPPGPAEASALSASPPGEDGTPPHRRRPAASGSTPDAASVSPDGPTGGDEGAGLLLTARCLGEAFDPRRHLLAEVKAVTYHQAEVRETPDGWRGVFIVDV